MGERLEKIALIVFALMAVAVFAIMSVTIVTKAISANEEITRTITSSDSALAVYDGSSIYGASVLDAAKNPGKIGSTVTDVYVLTSAQKVLPANVTAKKAAAQVYKETTAYNAGTVEDVDKVNNSAVFDSYLCYNSNGICIGVLFVQQDANKLTAGTMEVELPAEVVAVSGLAETTAGNHMWH